MLCINALYDNFCVHVVLKPWPPRFLSKKKSCILLFVQSKMPKIIVTGLLVQKSCNIKKTTKLQKSLYRISVPPPTQTAILLRSWIGRKKVIPRSASDILLSLKNTLHCILNQTKTFQFRRIFIQFYINSVNS